MSWQSEEVDRKSRGAKRVVRTVAVLLGMAVALTIGIYSWRHNNAVLAVENAQLRKAYVIDGPPCPTLSPAQYAALTLKPNKSFIFREVTFARRFGHADCGVLGALNPKDRGGVATCHFSGPAVLRVTTARGTSYFQPGIGYPATIFASDTSVRCVLASNFAGKYR
jgi:acyl CoA:acetate/3-ketoacid CoA transferase beta subunit